MSLRLITVLLLGLILPLQSVFAAGSDHEPISRGEFLTELMQTVGTPENLSEQMDFHYKRRHAYVRFRDVAVAAPYAPAVEWAFQQGLIRGRRDGLFYPEQALTRAAAAKLITKAFDLPVDFETPPPYYTDINPNAWYIPYLQAVIQSDLMRGYSAAGGDLPRFGPANHLTRAEANTTLERAADISTPGPELAVPEGVSTGGVLKILLDPSMPIERTTATRTSDLEFLCLKLISASDEGSVVTGVEIRRRGVGLDSEIGNIRAFVDGEEVAHRSGFNSRHIAQLYFHPAIIVPAGETVELSVRADFEGAQPGSTYHRFEIPSYQAWSTLDSSYIITPESLHGPEYKRIQVENAQLVYAMLNAEEELSVQDRRNILSRFSLEARQEDIKITRIVFENQGSLDREYLDDLRLYIGRSRKGELVESSDEDKIVFDLSDSPYRLERNTRKIAKLEGDIRGGSGETVALDIDPQNGISAVDTKHDLSIRATRSELSVGDIARTVEGGSLTVREGTNNPRGHTIYAGDHAQTIATFEFESTGEAMLLEDLNFELTTENFQNFLFEELTFHWGGREVESFSPGSVGSETFTLEGPLELPANRRRMLTVRAEIAETLSDETGEFQLVWHALEDDNLNFRATREINDDQLERFEVLPEHDLTIRGGLFRVKESIY